MAAHIYAFVNELSFQEQFSLTEIADGLLQFLQTLNRIKDVKPEIRSIMYCESMYQRQVSHGLSYASAIRSVTGEQKDSILQLKISMDKSGWEKMEDIGFFQEYTRQYSVGTMDVSRSILAEAYEYKDVASTDDHILIINMPKSSFSKTIAVRKDTANQAKDLESVNNENEVLAYLQEKNIPIQYDPKSTKHPLPEQTILGNTHFFTKTQRTNMGEVLYERIGHNELWCLDNIHFDGHAHFEIFSKADDVWKGDSYDLQNVNPDYTSKKHKGSKIRG